MARYDSAHCHFRSNSGLWTENARALEGFLSIPHKRAMEIARTPHLFND